MVPQKEKAWLKVLESTVFHLIEGQSNKDLENFTGKSAERCQDFMRVFQEVCRRMQSENNNNRVNEEIDRTVIRISFKQPDQLPDLMIFKEEYKKGDHIRPYHVTLLYDEEKLTSDIAIDGDVKTSKEIRVYPSL